MTKKKPRGESDKEQSERFKQAAQKLIDAGELSPTEADSALDAILKKSARRQD